MANKYNRTLTKYIIKVAHTSVRNKVEQEYVVNRVNKLIDLSYKQNPNDLTNEQLVLIIQKYNDPICWDLLFQKTEKLAHKLMNKYVNDYYKKYEYDDTFSTLKIGWTKSVNKYNIYKATAGFVPFASTLMKQEYINSIFSRRSANRNGLSVVTIPIGTTVSNDVTDTNDISNVSNAFNILKDKHSEDEFDKIEMQDLIDTKMRLLKSYYPMSYLMIKENIFNDKTQMEIAEQYNIKQSAISRHIKTGKLFLKSQISEEEYIECNTNKNIY